MRLLHKRLRLYADAAAGLIDELEQGAPQLNDPDVLEQAVIAGLAVDFIVRRLAELDEDDDEDSALELVV